MSLLKAQLWAACRGGEGAAVAAEAALERDYVPPSLDLHRASRTSAPATPTRPLAANTRSPAAIDIRGLSLGSPRWPDSPTSSTPPALDSCPINSPGASLGPQCAPLIVTPRVTSPIWVPFGSPRDEARDGGVGGEGGKGKVGEGSSSRGGDAGEGLSQSSFDASGAVRPVAEQAPDSPPISHPHLSPHPTGNKRGEGQRHSPHRGSAGSSPAESAVLTSRLEQGLRSLAQSPLFLTRARP